MLRPEPGGKKQEIIKKLNTSEPPFSSFRITYTRCHKILKLHFPAIKFMNYLHSNDVKLLTTWEKNTNEASTSNETVQVKKV